MAVLNHEHLEDVGLKMPDKTTKYERLSGSGVDFLGMGFASLHTLWLGPDHLLSVSSSGFRENYKRFYLRDIQAIVMKRTLKWLAGNIAWGLLCVLLLVPAVLGVIWEWSPYGVAALEVPLAIVFIGFLLNLIRGPTCACYLKTAVQTDRLEALMRRRTAIVVMTRLKELIEGAQGVLSPEEIARREAGMASVLPQSAVPEVRKARVKPIRHIKGRIHFVVFVLFLADVCDTLCEMVMGFHAFPRWFMICLLLALIMCLVLAAIRQYNSNMPRKLRILPWLGMAYIVLSLIFGIIFASVLMASVPEELVSVLALPSPHDSLTMMVFCSLSALCSALIGILGLVWLHRFRQQTDKPPPMPGSDTESGMRNPPSPGLRASAEGETGKND